jgi:hypothetical protein
VLTHCRRSKFVQHPPRAWDNRRGHCCGAPSATWRCTSSCKAEVVVIAQRSCSTRGMEVLVVASCGDKTSSSCNSGWWQHVRIYWRGYHARYCWEHRL